MKTSTYLTLISLFILFSCSKKENNVSIESIKIDEPISKSIIYEQIFEEKYEYVNSIEGLRVRKEPNINSERLALLRHRDKIKIIEIGEKVTIDNIEGNWVLIEIQNISGWVFNGYLVLDENFNIFSDAGKTFEIINAGYFLVENQYETNEIEIILSDKNFDLNYPLHGQTVEDYSIIRLSIPEDNFRSGNFNVFQEGGFLHSDKTPGRYFKVREYIIELVDGFIKLNFKVNMYNGIQRSDELIEFSYIGSIIKLPYKYENYIEEENIVY